jgi:hypothetical protein
MTNRIVTFGELMLRLKAPGHERLFQSPLLEASFGGGEANVAVSLCRFGLDARFVTALSNDAVGDAAVRALRGHGIDTSRIVRRAGRTGIYFLEAGADQRPSQVIYDRAGSAAAAMTPGDFDWGEILSGAAWFHVTGITPALSRSAADVTIGRLGSGNTILVDPNSSILLDYFKLSGRSGGTIARGGTDLTDKLVLSDLVRFNLGYWWVVGLCVAFYASIFPFRTFANLFLIDAHGVSPERAGELKSILPMFSMIGMPILGFVVDRVGRRALFMLVGSALLVPPFLLMAYTRLPLEFSMGMLGLAFALVPAVLWPAVTYLVPEQRLGSAYALMTFCQQVAWAGMGWGMGAVKDAAHASAANPGGWLPVMWMLAALSMLGFVFSFLLWRSERGPGGHGLETIKA